MQIYVDGGRFFMKKDYSGRNGSSEKKDGTSYAE